MIIHGYAVGETALWTWRHQTYTSKHNTQVRKLVISEHPARLKRAMPFLKVALIPEIGFKIHFKASNMYRFYISRASGNKPFRDQQFLAQHMLLREMWFMQSVHDELASLAFQSELSICFGRFADATLRSRIVLHTMLISAQWLSRRL